MPYRRQWRHGPIGLSHGTLNEHYSEIPDWINITNIVLYTFKLSNQIAFLLYTMKMYNSSKQNKTFVKALDTAMLP